MTERGIGSSLIDGPMVLREQEDGSAILEFGEGTGRKCGDCTLCCKLLAVPVPPVNKPAGVRCRYVRARKGCTIYPYRPGACRTWFCRWICDPNAHALTRPNRSGFVVDLEYDKIRTQNNETGELGGWTMLQVWVDPEKPNAYRSAECRRYLQHMAKKFGVGAIVRFDSQRAVLVFAPALTGAGWHEEHNAKMQPRGDGPDEVPYQNSRLSIAGELLAEPSAEVADAPNH